MGQKEKRRSWERNKHEWATESRQSGWQTLHSKYGLFLKTPANSLISAFISRACKKASESQSQNWWLRDCGYLTNKILRGQWMMLCTGWACVEKAGQFKLGLDVQDRLNWSGTCRVHTRKIHWWRLSAFWQDKTLSDLLLTAKDRCYEMQLGILRSWTIVQLYSTNYALCIMFSVTHLEILPLTNKALLKANFIRLAEVSFADIQSCLYFISPRYLLYYLFPVRWMHGELLLLYFIQSEAQVISELMNRLYGGDPECLPFPLEKQLCTPKARTC